MRIFLRHPELRSLFPYGYVFRDVRDAADLTTERLTAVLEEARQHPTYCKHVVAFYNAIGMAVESMDDWDGELTATLLQLGRMHWKAEGFTVQNFSIFVQLLTQQDTVHI